MAKRVSMCDWDIIFWDYFRKQKRDPFISSSSSKLNAWIFLLVKCILFLTMTTCLLIWWICAQLLKSTHSFHISHTSSLDTIHSHQILSPPYFHIFLFFSFSLKQWVYMKVKSRNKIKIIEGNTKWLSIWQNHIA